MVGNTSTSRPATRSTTKRGRPSSDDEDDNFSSGGGGNDGDGESTVGAGGGAKGSKKARQNEPPKSRKAKAKAKAKAKPKTSTAAREKADKEAALDTSAKVTPSEQKLLDGSISVAPPPRARNQTAVHGEAAPAIVTRQRKPVPVQEESSSGEEQVIDIKGKAREEPEEEPEEEGAPVESDVGSRPPSQYFGESDLDDELGAQGDEGLKKPNSDTEKPEQDIEMEGASRTTEGVFRGQAHGNVVNFADFQLEPDSLRPVEGKVRVFHQTTFDPIDPTVATKFSVAKLKVQTKLGPLLVELASKNDPIKREDRNIYIFEDGEWITKGRYSTIIGSDERIKWDISSESYVLYVIAETSSPMFNFGVGPPPGPPSSATPGSSHLGSRSASASLHPSDSMSNVGPALPQTQLSQSIFPPMSPANLQRAQLLEIPPHLIPHKRNPPLKWAFAKYNAVQAATAKYESMVTDGQWTGPKTVNKDIIELFVPGSTWFTSYKSFDKVFEYPEMVAWLKKDGNTSGENFELWGKMQTKFVISDLVDWMEIRGKEKAEKEKKKERKEKEKGKGKEKERSDEESSTCKHRKKK